MSLKNDRYIIPLESLEEGVYEIDYKIGKEFIEEQGIEDVSDLNVLVHVVFTKRSQIHSLEISMSGKVEVPCDRCLHSVKLNVDYSQTFVVKTALENDEDADDVILLSPEDKEVGLSHVFYESLILSLPLKRVHAPGKCNKSVTAYLSTNEQKDEQEQTDPRWDALKNIFNN